MIVVADTSVFLNLGCIRQEELLPALYGEVFAPPEVRDEFAAAVERYLRFHHLIFPAWVRVQATEATSRSAGSLGTTRSWRKRRDCVSRGTVRRFAAGR